MSRYFLVTFSGLDSEMELRTGKIENITEGGKYVSERFIIQTVQKAYSLTHTFVSAITELNKKDYHDFIEGRNESGYYPDMGDPEDTSFI